MDKHSHPFLKITCLASVLGLLLFATVGCGTLELGIEQPRVTDERVRKTIAAMETMNSKLAALLQTTPLPSTKTPTSSVQATTVSQTSVPETSVPKTPTRAPALTETPGSPQFSTLYFSTQPDGPPQRFFVQGIQRVYAVWDYKNMDIGMVYRRLWEKDGELWSERYTTWDIPKYGSQGTMQDIFIFDFDFGLQPGMYSLTLDINGEIQAFNDGETTVDRMEFWVVPADISGSIPSPNRAYSIYIFGGGRLTVGDQEGNMRDLVVTTEISSVAWFPDSQHILYTDRDRTNQRDLESDLGITHQLWILDVVTGQRDMLGTTQENYHHPVISPGGRYIAVLSGDTFLEDCQASPRLKIIELDSQHSPVNTFEVTDFSGLPVDPNRETVIYPSAPNRPGYWETDNTLSTSLSWTCSENSALNDGLYILKLENFQAERYGQ